MRSSPGPEQAPMTPLGPKTATRVFIVDPDLAVVAGLTSILNEIPNVHVVASAVDRQSALSLIDGDTDAVIVVARRFPFDDGYEICRALRANAPRARFVIHSAASIDEHDMVRGGGAAVVLKQLDNDDLIRTISDLA